MTSITQNPDVPWHTVQQYQAALSRSIYPIELELAGPSIDFRAGVVNRTVGCLSLSRATANAAFQCHRQVLRAPDDEGYFVLQLQESGCTAYRHQGRSAVCEAGSLILMDARKPIVGEQFGAADALIVKIPARIMQVLLPKSADYCTTSIAATGGSAHMLANMVKQFWTCTSTLTDYDRQSLPQTLGRLTATVFHSNGSTQNFTSRQFDRLRCAIFEHAGDSELSAEVLSRMLNVSRRTLYALTRRAATTVEKLIIDARLAQVESKLSDPAFDEISLTDLAFESGFQDLSHFSRRFKEKYAMSPRAYRQARPSMIGHA